MGKCLQFRLPEGGGSECSLEEENLKRVLEKAGSSPTEAKRGLTALILSGELALKWEDEQRIFTDLRNLEGKTP